MTFTPNANRLAVEISLPVLTTVCRGWDSNIQPYACGANALTHCVTSAASSFMRQMIEYDLVKCYLLLSSDGL